ncbi:MAG: CapA family protein [Deltaproteobacteria bacterium]|nr:CapA family protein [Deltaproteobacteria bacterium]
MNRILLIIVFAITALFFSIDLFAEKNGEEEKGEIVIQAVGDIMPTARVLPFVKKHGFDYPYRATAKLFKSADLVIGNMEAPITTGGSRFKNKKFTFKAPLESAAALKAAGVTHLSLANNHMMDYGMKGLVSTLKALDDVKINYAGAGITLGAARKSSIYEVKGKKIAFLSYSKTYPFEFYATKKKGGTAPGYAAYVKRDIRKARKLSDIVIVAFHWGAEKRETPKDYQRELAHLSIDSGAHIVLGHHPHVLQGIEYYGEGIIFYSLGNFVFGSYSKSATESIIARITVDNDGIGKVEALPLNVNNYEVNFQPGLLTGKRGSEIISRLSRLSEPLGSRLLFADNAGVASKMEKLTMSGASSAQD